MTRTHAFFRSMGQFAGATTVAEAGMNEVSKSLPNVRNDP